MSKHKELRRWAVAALKNWTKNILVWGALAAGFYYWFAFTAAQSVVLGILFGCIFWELLGLGKKADTNADFIPYRVSIRIHNHRDFLFKSGLVQSEEAWERVWKTVDDTSILRRGLNFTVLSLNKEGLPHLVWWDDHKTFLAGLPSFEDDIQGLELLSSHRLNGKFTPRLYFGYLHGTLSGGYNLAVCVVEDWWDKNKTEKLQGYKDHSGSVYITLGALPYGELGLDYEARRQDREKELEKLGWTIKDFHEWDAPGLNSIRVENDYFSVEQQSLETD
ncbi:MAG TPA: hypothetical protein VGR97_11850 [Candidatus Acidoferrales bacterium]|nr:hypothetical protein [Candidatus Acidoferrales bacterium]